MCLDYNDDYEDWNIWQNFDQGVYEEDTKEPTEPLNIPIAKTFVEMLAISQLLADYQLLRGLSTELFDKYTGNLYGTYSCNYTPKLIEDVRDIDLYDRVYRLR